MATPSIQNRPAPVLPSKTLEDYQWYAKNAAIYIHQRIPTHLEDHEGQVEYNDFAMDVIRYFTRTIPNFENYNKDTFLNCLETELKNRLADLPFPHNRISLPIFQRLMMELREKLLPKEERHDRSRISPGFTNRSRMNSMHLGVTHGIGEHGTVAAGVFRSGDTGTALSQYLVYHHQWYQLNDHFLKAGIVSSVGLFSLLPDDDPEKRYVLGVVPSLSLFIGSEQSLPLGLKLREAVEWQPSLPVGIHLIADLHMPLTAGAVLGRRFGNTHLYSGGKVEWLPAMRDVQDMRSLGIAREKIEWFTGIESSLIDTRIALDFFSNETVARLQLSKSLQFAGGLTTFALVGQAALSGTWNAEATSAFFMLNYTQNSGRYQVRTQLAVDLMTDEESKYSATQPALGFDAAQVSVVNKKTSVGTKPVCDLTNYYKKGSTSISCSVPGITNGAALPCEINNKTKEVQCTAGYKPFDVKYKIALAYQGNQLTEQTVTDQSIVAKDPVLASMTNNTTRAGFVQTIRALGKDQQLAGLQQLPTILYRTYNGKGMATLLGDDTINLIGSEELYQGIRKYLLDPKSVDPTTVCRGIAKFVAGVAADLGYEAHVIGIRTPTLWHSIPLIREPGENYMALNYGDNVGYTGHRDIAGALLQFAKNNGYPPQLKFMIFDQGGRYERTLITNEGRLVTETTTAPAHAQDFLEFR